jgi:hypothetical protein
MGNSGSKEQFRDRIEKLIKEEISLSNHSFWDALFSNFSIEEIFNLLSPKDIKLMNKNHQENLGFLMFKVTIFST